MGKPKKMMEEVAFQNKEIAGNNFYEMKFFLTGQMKTQANIENDKRNAIVEKPPSNNDA